MLELILFCLGKSYVQIVQRMGTKRETILFLILSLHLNEGKYYIFYNINS